MSDSGKTGLQEQELDGNTQSFIVRIWHEAAGEGKALVWRGSVTHVGSGKRAYFRNLNSLKQFVVDWTGMEQPGSFWQRLRSLFPRSR